MREREEEAMQESGRLGKEKKYNWQKEARREGRCPDNKAWWSLSACAQHQVICWLQPCRQSDFHTSYLFILLLLPLKVDKSNGGNEASFGETKKPIWTDGTDTGANGCTHYALKTSVSVCVCVCTRANISM